MRNAISQTNDSGAGPRAGMPMGATLPRAHVPNRLRVVPVTRVRP
jgi:hypothetical protein